MRKGLFMLVLASVVAFAVSAAMGQSPVLKGEMSARKIVVDRENREVAVPAEEVYPEDTVEYILKYYNSGNSTATGVELTGPIPAGTVYIEETATANEDCHPLFSIDDGKTYQEAPVTYTVTNPDGEEVEKKAPPHMITHIKWSVKSGIEVDQFVKVSYRVQVK
jgi:uncharacterized repeat protein (TIGR01451 family)